MRSKHREKDYYNVFILNELLRVIRVDKYWGNVSNMGYKKIIIIKQNIRYVKMSITVLLLCYLIG